MITWNWKQRVEAMERVNLRTGLRGDALRAAAEVEMAENAAKEPVFNVPAYNQTIFDYKRRFEGGYRERTFARTLYHHNMARWREGLPSL